MQMPVTQLPVQRLTQESADIWVYAAAGAVDADFDCAES
jgi:hypothetical protein